MYDPVVRELPSRWSDQVERFESALEVLDNTKVLILGTEWAEFKETAIKLLKFVENDYLVIDANRFLHNVIIPQGINYTAVGMPQKTVIND